MRPLIAWLLVPAMALLTACAPPAGGGNSPAQAPGATGTAATSSAEMTAATAESATNAEYEIVMGDNFFNPVELAVEPGAEITVINRGGFPHNFIPRG